MLKSGNIFKEFCLIWVEFVNLPAWLWGSIKDLAGKLGTPLFVLSNRDLGKASNKVCIYWNVLEAPLENMIINVRAGLVVVPLKFGTNFGACFRCNGFGHFDKS